MADGTIQDNQISASSVYSNAKYAIHFARLDNSNGCWASATNDLNQWIQVAFDTPVIINGITTQGFLTSYVTAYKVQYLDDNGWAWFYVQDNRGNDVVSFSFKTY